MLSGGYVNYGDETDITLLDSGALRVVTEGGEHLIGPGAWLAVVDTDDKRQRLTWGMLAGGDAD